MASDGPTPPPCDQDIFEKGETILTIYGRSNAVERWVVEVAKSAEAKVDWHYAGGVASVKHLGDSASLLRTYEAMFRLLPKLQGQVINQLERARAYDKLKRELSVTESTG
jgi:hypothetical protein